MSKPSSAFHTDPDILGGVPVFVGTRAPVRTLLDYLASGDPLEVFLDDFPTVSREQAVEVLGQASDLLVSHAPGSRSGSNQGLPRIEEVPRLRVGSPRLAEPGRAADFTMDVAEEARDAGLR